MLKNYFIAAIRNLVRNRVFSFINIIGLVLGITGAVIIYRIIAFEGSFDGYHDNSESIYRIALHQETDGDINKVVSVQHPLGAALKQDMPDAKVSRIHWYYSGIFNVKDDQNIEKKFRMDKPTAFVEQDFFSIFTFIWLAGNPNHLLDEPNTIVMSASGADKLFDLKGEGYQSLLGKTVDFENKLTLKITGVYQDPPKNTDFDVDYFMEYQGANIYPYANGLTSWETRNGSARCLIKLPKGQTEESAEAQLIELSAKYLAPTGVEANVYFALQPLSDIHMSEEYGRQSVLDSSSLNFLKMMGLILILIAAINFVNLATAQSVKRAKEIGIRKVLGSSKKHLIAQFLGEVFIITVLSVIISLGLSEAALMKLEPFLGYSLGLNMFNDPSIILFLVGLTVLVTLLSGFYPAIILSGYSPVEAIKSSRTSKKGKGLAIRRVLVVLQFLISQALIVGTLVVVFQMDFMKNQPLGFKTDNVLTFSIPNTAKEKIDLLRAQLSGIPTIEGISFYVATPGAANTNNVDAIKNPNGGEEVEFGANRKNVDTDYLEVFDLELLAGEFIREGVPENHTVVNRKFVEKMGLQNPEEIIGETVETNYGGKLFIIGVVEDFHNKSMRSEIDPVFLMYGQNQFFEGGIKINPKGDLGFVISQVEAAWNKVFTNDIFNYQFLDDRVAKQYEREARISELSQIMAGMAIFICCLGLYGLISFMANQKVKEIGIRKVLGASVTGIIRIFTNEVMILVFVAFLLAAPLTYYIMDGWLDSYVYRIGLGLPIFAIGILVTIIIAMLTVGSSSFKAATANPIKSLRDE